MFGGQAFFSPDGDQLFTPINGWFVNVYDCAMRCPLGTLACAAAQSRDLKAHRTVGPGSSVVFDDNTKMLAVDRTGLNAIVATRDTKHSDSDQCNQSVFATSLASEAGIPIASLSHALWGTVDARVGDAGDRAVISWVEAGNDDHASPRSVHVLACSVPDGKVLMSESRPSIGSYVVDLSPDGRRLVLASVEPGEGKVSSTFEVYDVETGVPIHTATLASRSIRAVDWHPNGLSIAIGTREGEVTLWELGQGAVKSRLSNQGSPVTSVCFNPTGTRLISGSTGRLTVWDPWRGDRLLDLRDYSEEPQAVEFSPDGHRLVASGEAELRVWDATPASEMWQKSRLHERALLRIDEARKQMGAGKSVAQVIQNEPDLDAAVRDYALRLDALQKRMIPGTGEFHDDQSTPFGQTFPRPAQPAGRQPVRRWGGFMNSEE